MSKVAKFKNGKVTKAKCTPTKCMNKEHGDQICEAIRILGSSDDHSICYITQLCDAFCFALDSWGRSALHTASLVGKNKVVHYLATHGANVNLQDSFGNITPLHCAILENHIDTAIILLKYGADATIPDRRIISPANCLSAQQPLKIFHPIKPPTHHGYSWGINTNYNLGLASGQAREAPEYFEVPLKKGNTLTTVSMNKFHSVFLSSSGKVFVCGHGQGGRLGLKTDSSVVVPQLIKVSPHKIIRISAGIDHTLFLDENNTVFSCGMNKYHQLGFSECPYNIFTPHLLMQWHAKNPGINVLGIAAGAYHSVIWTMNEIFTCGLNAGQLGHIDIHNETFVDLPKSINFVKNLKKSRVGQISDVTVSDGAIVILTSFGNIIACYEHKAHFIPLNATVVKKIACTGGNIDTNLGVDLPSDYKNEELRIAILLMNGDLIVWVEKALHHRVRGCELVWNIPKISDFCINSRDLCLVDCHGEVYFGHFDDKTYYWRPKDDKHTYAYFYSRGLCDTKSIGKVKKVPHLYRTRFIFCDPRGNNYIALQYDPKLFLKRKVSRISNSLKHDIADYYDKVINFGGDYDVEISVGNRLFPSHAYILAYHSDVLHDKLVEDLSQNDCRTANGKIHLKLEDIDADVFEEILNIIYFHDFKKGKFNELNRFIRDTSKEEDKKWQRVNFVHLHRKGENDISETIKKSRHLKDDPKEMKQECLQYPLKPVKELSCSLKMKKLQDALLEINMREQQSQEISQQSRVLEVYAPSMIYSRNMYPELWDVSFHCEDKKVVKAHRVILMARSSYFDALLGSRWNQEQENDLVDICIPSIILIPILDYLYADESLSVSQSNDLDFLCQVIMYSHQYMIEGLHSLCQRSIARLITLKNSLDLLKLCHIYHASSLKEVILEFICLNMTYYFDNKIFRNLEEETIMDVSSAYQEVVLPSGIQPSKKLLSNIEENFIHEYIEGRNDVIEEMKNGHVEDIEETGTEICGDIMSRSRKSVRNFHIRDQIDYIPDEATEGLRNTKLEATSLPTLEDLETSLRKNSYIIHQTPEEWAEEFKETHLSPADNRKESNSERKNKSSSHKRRSRKTSSSSQMSTSSSSEPEYTLDLKDSSANFSFDDLEDKLLKEPHTEEDWKVVKKNKHEISGSHDVESEFKNLNIQENQKLAYSQHEQSAPQVCDGFSPLRDAPFPTLFEALTVLKKTPSQFKSFPKFQSKSGKKCKKSQSAAEEEKLSPSAKCAWGFGSPEKYSSLREVMKRESSSEDFPTNSCSSSPGSKVEQQKSFLQNESQQLKRREVEEELCHWNPVTHAIVQSPREANDVSFLSIVKEEVMNKKHLEFESNKPLSLIQLEETAIKELLEFHGGEFNPEERVTVTRYGAHPVKPSWNVQLRRL